MRSIGGKVANAADSRFDALEHLIQRCRQMGQFIARLQLRQAGVCRLPSWMRCASRAMAATGVESAAAQDMAGKSGGNEETAGTISSKLFRKSASV